MKITNFKNNRAQSSMEYLLILTMVGVIVLASLRFLLPKVNTSSEGYFNSVTRVVLGEKPQPINGGWCEVQCPPQGGSGGPSVMYKTCECPAPAFGGAYCQGSEVVQCN